MAMVEVQTEELARVLRGKPRFDAGMNLPETGPPHEFGRKLADGIQQNIQSSGSRAAAVCVNAVVGARISSAVRRRVGIVAKVVSCLGCGGSGLQFTSCSV
jgi:hypothetical protein